MAYSIFGSAMQNYKEESKDKGFGKKILLEFLDYLSFKVKNDSLTMEETDSLARTFMENITLTGTIDDLARYYGQSRDNVKVVINRKLLSKPKRRVYYSFNAFNKIIPKSWHKRNKNEEDK